MSSPYEFQATVWAALLVAGVGVASGALAWHMLTKTRGPVLLERVPMREITLYGRKLPLWLLVSSIAAFAGGLYVFRNPVTAFVAAVLIGILPDQFAFWRAGKRKEMALEQLTAAVRLFAAEYSVAPQLARCLGVVASRIGSPLGPIFRRAYTALVLGTEPEEVLAALEKDLEIPEGKVFVQLLRAGRHQGQALVPLFHDLVSRISVRQQLAKFNRTETSGERAVGMVMALMPIPTYFLMQIWIPESRYYFTETAFGRMVVAFSFISALLWFLIDRVVGEV